MISLIDIILPPSVSINDAMSKMTANKKGILFICDDYFHLKGVLTDGDLRRAMQNQISINAPVKQIMNIDPVTASDLDSAKSLLEKYSLIAIPVVDAKSCIKKILFKDSGNILEIETKSGQAESDAAETLVIIPARGGSKRIPDKNLKKIGGKPLVQLAIECAQKCNRVGEIIVSTDSQKIADVAEKSGIEVPWLRPANLAEDTASTIDVILHALNWAKKEFNNKYKYALLLEPTAPLRRVNFLYDTINLLQQKNCDSVASVSELPHTFNPEEQIILKEGNILPYIGGSDLNSRTLRGRQTATYVMNGLVYGMNVESVLNNKSLFGETCIPYITDWDTFLDIDTPIDLKWARFRMGN